MHLLCFQSFGTHIMGAKEKKRFGISDNISCNIWVFLSGHTAIQNSWSKCQKKRAPAKLLFIIFLVLKKFREKKKVFFFWKIERKSRENKVEMLQGQVGEISKMRVFLEIKGLSFTNNILISSGKEGCFFLLTLDIDDNHFVSG